jgi:hypothetical protein
MVEAMQMGTKEELRFEMAMAHIDPVMWWKAEIQDQHSVTRLFHPDQHLGELPLFLWAGLDFQNPASISGSRDL